MRVQPTCPQDQSFPHTRGPKGPIARPFAAQTLRATNYAGTAALGTSAPVARTLEIIGDRWTWLIVRDAFLGISRFGEFQESLGVAANVLDDRLTRLVEEGIFDRVPYNERPTRFEYRLTQKGSDLFTALNALRQWGDQYLCAQPMRLLRVKGRETPVVAALVPEGTPALANEDIELVPGPGFPRS